MIYTAVDPQASDPRRRFDRQTSAEDASNSLEFGRHIVVQTEEFAQKRVVIVPHGRTEHTPPKFTIETPEGGILTFVFTDDMMSVIALAETFLRPVSEVMSEEIEVLHKRASETAEWDDVGSHEAVMQARVLERFLNHLRFERSQQGEF